MNIDNKDIKPEAKKNKNVKIIILITAFVLLGITSFIIYKAVRDFTRDDNVAEIDIPANVTLFECYMGKSVAEDDLGEIAEAVKGVVGDKYLTIEKGVGVTPEHNMNTDENGEEIYMGDGVTITFSVLDDNEKMDVFFALMEKFDINSAHLPRGLGRDITRADINTN